jgi:tocopherol O-methyltransferase
VIVPREPVVERDVAQHYDELDEFYRELWGEHVHHGLWITGTESPASATCRLGTLIAERGEIGTGTRVCDIGCGYGALARQWVQNAGAQVTAVTLSRVQYEYAKRKDPGRNPDYVCANWLRLPLPRANFDTAVACESFEHMTDKRQFFSQAFRALRPGGKLVICVWLAARRPSPWQARWLLEPICREGQMPSLMSEAELVHCASRAGFEDFSWEDLTLKVRRTWFLIVSRLAGRLVKDRRYRQFLLNPRRRNRLFALTTLRIWLAYHFGALRYGIFVFARPA